MAEVLEVELRTMRNWPHLDPAERGAPPGRPRTSEEERRAAREEVRRVLDEQGWGVGEPTLHHELKGRWSHYRIRCELKELKAARCSRMRRQREETRTRVAVHARDAVWSLDATHLGRDANGRAVQAEVVRDVASTRTIGLDVGPPACAARVVCLLDNMILVRGTAPLVLVTDNGTQYIGEEVRAWSRANGVLRLLSLPRTPQHNAWSEHGMRELKEEAVLGKGTLVQDNEWARARLETARERIDGKRRRATRGWMTAIAADREGTPWQALVDREVLLDAAACAIGEAVLHSQTKRARRRAVREAILGTLQRFSVITRTRGGRPWSAQYEEGVS